MTSVRGGGMLTGLLVLSSCLAAVWAQGFYYNDSTTFWVNETRLLMSFSGTKEWLDGSLDPDTDIIDFVDIRRAGESVATHYAWHQVIISERGTKTIAVFQSYSLAAVFAHVGTSPRVGHVTVDWVSNNVYWTDSGFGWIGLQGLKEDLSSFSFNARLKVVVYSSLEDPYGVTVLPYIKRIFWTDHGSTPKIESSDLLGRLRRVLVWQGLSKPTAISADHSTDQLYWVDEAKGTVETCDHLGNGRRILTYLENSAFGGLQVFEEYVIVSERTRGEIQAYNKATGQKAANPVTNVVNPIDIAVFSSTLQPPDNGTCGTVSCDHICIHQEGCVCSSGYMLAADNVTCEEQETSIWKSFIISTSRKICAIPVNLLFSHSYLSPQSINKSTICFVNSSYIRHLAIDSHNATLYYTSGRDVRRYRIHTGSDEVLVTASGDISGLAYDWRSGTVVWTQQGATKGLYSLSQGQSQPVSVYQIEYSPSHITVDSYRGRLFWIETLGGGVTAHLWSGTVDGSQGKGSIPATGLTQPQYLTYDHKTDRLFWLDVDHVGGIDPDGQNKHIINQDSVQSRIGLTVFRSYLVWAMEGTVKIKMAFRSAHLTDDDNVTVFSLPSKIDDVTDLVLYDATGDLDTGSVACEIDNGGCSQLCVVDGGGHLCRCTFGFTLHQDGVTCVSETVTSDFFLVTDSLSNQMHQIKGGSQYTVSAIPLQHGVRPRIAIFNYVTRDIIWYDVEAAAIRLSALDGSSLRVVKSLREAGQTKPNTVGAMTIDHSTGNLFFTESQADNSKGWIRVISLDSLVLRTLHESTPAPTYLAIAPQQGRLVYGTASGDIFLTDMATASTHSPLKSGVTGLSGLVFSQNGQSVEWSDSEEDGLWRVTLSGLTTERRLHNTGTRPRTLYAWGSNLYYLGSSGRSVHSLNDLDIETTELHFPEFGHLSSLFYLGAQAPNVTSSCSERNGRCSTLCLPISETTRSCQCADGVSLLPDRRTCSNVDRCPEQINNGQLSTTCDRYPAQECAFTCSENYSPNPNVPTSSMVCGPGGQWSEDTDTVCLSISTDEHKGGEEALPTYAIGIISAAGVAVLAVLLGCYLFRRMKKYNRRDKDTPGQGLGQGLNLGPAFQTPLPPGIVVTGAEEGAVGGWSPNKVVEDDAKSDEYAELDLVEDEVRYQSFSKISPVPGRKDHGRSRSPNPFSNGGVHNRGFNLQEEDDMRDDDCYIEPLPDYATHINASSTNTATNVPALAPPPCFKKRDGAQYLTPDYPHQLERIRDSAYHDPGKKSARPHPHHFHQPAGGYADSALPQVQTAPDYVAPLPPSAPSMSLRNSNTRSDWMA